MSIIPIIAAMPSYNKDQVIEKVISDRKKNTRKLVVDEAHSDGTPENEVPF